MMLSLLESFLSFHVPCDLWPSLSLCHLIWLMCDQVMLSLNPNPSSQDRIKKNKSKKKIKMKKKVKIIKVYHLWSWHYPPFKISPPEKLTSIFASFSPTSLNIPPWIFHHFIYIIFLLSISLVILLFWNPFPPPYLTFLIFSLLYPSFPQISPILLLCFLNPPSFSMCCFLP